MKRFFSITSVFLFLCMFMSLTSCSKDDDDDSSSSNLIGTWKLEESKWKYYEEGKLIDQGTDTDIDYKIIFQKNGVAMETKDANDGYSRIKWKLKNNQLTLVWVDEEDDPIIAQIQTLTNSKMVLVWADYGSDGKVLTTDTYKKVTKTSK